MPEEQPEFIPSEPTSPIQTHSSAPTLWLRIGLWLLLISLLAGGYLWWRSSRASAIRARMEQNYDQVIAPVTNRLKQLRNTVEKEVWSTKSGISNHRTATQIKLSSLHDQEVLYLKVHAADLTSGKTLSEAIAHPTPDAVGACLGLPLIAVNQLTQTPKMLTWKWLEGSQDTDNMMRLHVREEQFQQAIELELPGLQKLTSASYFLLLVVQGKSRVTDPVDIFLWRLPDNKLLLQTRAQNRGKLITVANQINGTTTRRQDVDIDPMTTADCSLAAHIKSLLGEPTMTLESSN